MRKNRPSCKNCIARLCRALSCKCASFQLAHFYCIFQRENFFFAYDTVFSFPVFLSMFKRRYTITNFFMKKKESVLKAVKVFLCIYMVSHNTKLFLPKNNNLFISLRLYCICCTKKYEYSQSWS